MSAGALAARALALLGRTSGRVAVVAPRAPCLRAALRARVPATDGDAGAAVVAFVGMRAVPADRHAALATVRERLAPGAVVVLVDHSQPRALWRRPAAVLALVLRGLPPSRARYPAARELAALGFAVERLALAHGERLQLIAARRV